jgi:predicted ribosome quality control (RQC) complex YloA/Tae2 family protein
VDKRDDDRRVALVSLARALIKALSKLDRRIDAVRGDLARLQSAEAAADRARLFVAPAAHAPRGATKLESVDWSDGEPRRIELSLDPGRGAKEQIDAIFKLARRLKNGARIANERLLANQRARSALAEVFEALETQREEELDLAALEARARCVAPRDFQIQALEAPAAAAPGLRKRRPSPPPQPPFRTFLGERGARILVGRGAAHNDALTFDVARPHDLWLHAKGRRGAHVVVLLEKTHPCPPDVLVEAAHLAAHFSDARDDPLVEVHYTPRRYVRKPRGSAPGLVVLGREKVMSLRRNERLLRRLLDRET